MIRQICNVNPRDTATIRSTELLARLAFRDPDLILKEGRLRWYAHVAKVQSRQPFDIQVDGKLGPARPKLTWRQLTERDRREWKLWATDPHACNKSATWKGGPLMWILLLHLHVDKKSDDDDDVQLTVL